MSTSNLLEFGFDVLVFLVAVGIGRRRPWVPLIAFVWAVPYLGGNYIGGFLLGFAPAHALAFAIAVLTLTNRRAFPNGVHILRNRLYIYLGICVAAGLVGVCLVYARAGFIDQWLQQPPLRVLRSTGVELLRWLLLIAPVMLATREKLAGKLVRHAILAGLFYCGLGLAQFASEQTVHYDPFPIARVTIGESTYHSQSVMDTGLNTRINSICGEPRYLAAYSCLWFCLVAALGKRVGLTARVRILISIVFLVTLVLTGSRTGLLILLLSGLVVTITALFTGRVRQAAPLLAIGLVLMSIFSALIINKVGSFGARNSQANLEDISSLQIGGIKVPIEWQEIGGISVMMQNPWQVPIGMGPGLWQYYVNPWDQLAVSRAFMDASSVGLDSQRSNIQILARFCDVGLIGCIAVVSVMIGLYRHGKSRVPVSLRGEYLLTFMLVASLMQFAGMADLLTFLMMGSAVQIYRELGPNVQAKDPSSASARPPQLKLSRVSISVV